MIELYRIIDRSVQELTREKQTEKLHTGVDL